MTTKTHDEASSVAAEEGVVFVDGPDGVAVALTPSAAADTSDRLLHAANQAQEQDRAAPPRRGKGCRSAG